MNEDNDILDEVAEGPLPQDDATTAEVETQETEAATGSAIERYLLTVRESIQNEIKQHMRPICYIQGDFFHRKRHAVFALRDDSATGFNVDSLCARDVFVWLPLLPGAPDFFKCTCGERLIKHGTVSLYFWTMSHNGTLGYNNNPIARRVRCLPTDYFLLTNRYRCKPACGCRRTWQGTDPHILAPGHPN